MCHADWARQQRTSALAAGWGTRSRAAQQLTAVPCCQACEQLDERAGLPRSQLWLPEPPPPVPEGEEPPEVRDPTRPPPPPPPPPQKTHGC